MAETMLKEEVPVYSVRHDVHGIIRDYGMVMKLFFIIMVVILIMIFVIY